MNSYSTVGRKRPLYYSFGLMYLYGSFSSWCNNQYQQILVNIKRYHAHAHVCTATVVIFPSLNIGIIILISCFQYHPIESYVFK